MSDRISRRGLARAAAAAAVGAALPIPATAAPQEPKEPDGHVEAEYRKIVEKLETALSAEAQKLTRAAIAGNLAASKERWKTNLPENSEPCFTFSPSPRERTA
ncbi:MAG TPA: hypothetical protein VM328_12480 [Fimbriimonadaceae bacterium]|nr:hypothetical protein [Fimbriimonadaceae bacterium]